MKYKLMKENENNDSNDEQSQLNTTNQLEQNLVTERKNKPTNTQEINPNEIKELAIQDWKEKVRVARNWWRFYLGVYFLLFFLWMFVDKK